MILFLIITYYWSYKGYFKHQHFKSMCQTQWSNTSDSIMMILVYTVMFILCIEAAVAFSYSLHHAKHSTKIGKDYSCDVLTLSQTRLSR
jgi:hypothetical protein